MTDRRDLKKYITLSALLSSAFATVLSTSMVRVASPYIQEAFELRYADLTWIHNSYQLSYAILLPVFGQLGDRFGRRRILLIGLVLFGLGSLLCGFAWGLLSMSVFRLIQGIGAAAIFPNALVLGTGIFSSRERGKAMGIWAMGVSLGSVAGPTIGGIVIQFMGWRYVFFINIIFLIASLGSIIFMVSNTESTSSKGESFDFGGTIVLAVMMTLLVTAMVNGPELGWLHIGVLTMLGLMVGCVHLFARIEFRQKQPIIDPAFFRNRVFLTGVLCGGMHLVAIQAMNFLMPLFLARVHGMNALAIGLMMLPQAAIRFVVSPVSGALSDRYGPRLPATLGLIARTLALVSFAFLTPLSTTMRIALCLVLDGAGAALIWAPSMNAAIESFPQNIAGSVAGVFNMLRFVMGVVGTVMVGVLLDMFFVDVPLSNSVPGFFHAYLALAALTALSLTQVKYLNSTAPSTATAEGVASKHDDAVMGQTENDREPSRKQRTSH